MDDYAPLTVGDYAQDAARTDRGVEGQSLAFPLLGLAGEVGSLLSELKKKQRDPASYRSHSDAVTEELRDVLWYLAAVARRGLSKRFNRTPYRLVASPRSTSRRPCSISPRTWAS